MRWLQLAAAVLSASAFTVHQHSTEEHCVDLQCPATAFEYGVRNLISEETLRSDKCMSCQQCTGSGYSLCLSMSSSRGRRGGDESGCSCTHSVPANCHNQLSNTRHPANITMNLFHVCYLSALQAPPRALAVNDKATVIVTVESFWHEPYWRDLQMDNLTLHYEFIVQKPEHCEGDLITNEGDRVEHVCKNFVNLEMSGMSEEPREDDDYEHSDNYDQYDDSLPPEVQFDRDVFDGAKLLKVFYTVEVRRPRQLTSKGSSDPFRDVTTTLESEVLKFDLKPEVYGTGEVPELPSPTDFAGTTDGVEDDENVSEEHGDGTNFFVDDVKDTKSEEQLEKEEEDLEKEIADITSGTTTTTKMTASVTFESTTNIAADEEEETTTQEDEEEETTTEAEEEETTTEKEEEQEEEEDKEAENEEDKEDDVKTEDVEENKEEEETTTAHAEDEEQQGEEQDGDGEQQEKEGETETTEDEEKPVDDEEEAEETETITEKTVDVFGYSFTKQDIARICLGISGVILVLSCLLWWCRKRICCCYQSETKTTSNGYRYNNPNRTNELVCNPEKERLHQ